MKDNINEFLYNLPHLDLHGFDRTGVVEILKQFISDNYELKCYKFIIVHGKGKGVLKNAAYDVLREDDRVLSYAVNSFNDGETVVILRNPNMSQPYLEEKYHGIVDLDENELLSMKKYSEHYTVDSIHIRNILGKFQYNIEFSNENKVFVIHAPNGCGKTNLLKYIDYFMNGNYDKLQNGVFDELQIVCKDSFERRHYFSYSPIDPDHRDKDIKFIPNCLLIKDLHKFSTINTKKDIFKRENMLDRIETFNSIMNLFFCYEKEVVFSNTIKDRYSIIIKYIDENHSNTPNLYRYNQNIKLEDMSSGEQFIIKLFYYLIFDLKINGFVELDEPEISLHVEWQELLIKNLVKISNKYNIRILIATHSPYLLNNLDVKVGNAEYD